MGLAVVVTIRKRRFRQGLSLVDTMASIAILIIAVIGTSSYRYNAALNVRKANNQITAARIANLLCESWQGQNGDPNYKPIAHLGSELEIVEGDFQEDYDESFTLLEGGSCKITIDGFTYYTTLIYKDINPSLSALNVTVSWAQWEAGKGDVDGRYKSFKLTTYTEK